MVSFFFIRNFFIRYNEKESDKETGGTICEKVHRGQEAIGFRRGVEPKGNACGRIAGLPY